MATKYICLPFANEAHYRACVEDLPTYRAYVAQQYEQHPELFPAALPAGYTFHDSYASRKLPLRLRRIKLRVSGQVFTLRPSFVLPYLVARTDEVEKALYLRHWGVPFEALAYVFGRDALFWQRAWLSLGRANLVGTTVKRAAGVPRDLVADEKITWVKGREVSVPTTVGGGCVLGVTVSAHDDTAGLQAGYGEFAHEAAAVFPAYTPRSVCTDGWRATREAWRSLYPQLVLVLCYLHGVLKIMQRCTGALRHRLCERAWHTYHAPSRRVFAQRLRRFKEWADTQLQGPVREAVVKLWQRRADYRVAYDCPTAARTSNAVDRWINHLDRLLYAMCYGHDSTARTRLVVRAMALQWNFHPFGVRLRYRAPARESRFADLNGFVYHENWLHNLLIAASMGGLRL